MPLAASQPVQAAQLSATFYAGRKLGEMGQAVAVESAARER